MLVYIRLMCGMYYITQGLPIKSLTDWHRNWNSNVENMDPFFSSVQTGSIRFPREVTDMDGNVHDVVELSKKYVVVIITIKVGIITLGKGNSWSSCKHDCQFSIFILIPSHHNVQYVHSFSRDWIFLDCMTHRRSSLRILSVILLRQFRGEISRWAYASTGRGGLYGIKSY